MNFHKLTLELPVSKILTQSVLKRVGVIIQGQTLGTQPVGTRLNPASSSYGRELPVIQVLNTTIVTDAFLVMLLGALVDTVLFTSAIV